MNDKWKSVIISTAVLIGFVIFNIILFLTDFSNFLSYIIIYIDIFPVIFFVFSFLNHYKKIEYQGHIIEIYAGFINHYIKVDSITKDEYKGFSFTPINLKCSVDNKNVDIVISLTNNIKLKIDNELIKWCIDVVINHSTKDRSKLIV